METIFLTASSLPQTSLPPTNPVEAASIVPAMATPPDPASIPIAPPHGSPRPPLGQLLPDVAAAEDNTTQLQSPMKVNTPPPSTPSPVAIPQQAPAESFSSMEQPSHANGIDSGYGQSVLPADADLDLGFPQPDDSMFGDDTFRTEADGDTIMDEHQLENAKHDLLGNGESAVNGQAKNHNDSIEDSTQALYQQHSPTDFTSPTYNEQESFDGPPPAKRQKVDSVSGHGICVAHDH